MLSQSAEPVCITLKTAGPLCYYVQTSGQVIRADFSLNLGYVITN